MSVISRSVSTAIVASLFFAPLEQAPAQNRRPFHFRARYWSGIRDGFDARGTDHHAMPGVIGQEEFPRLGLSIDVYPDVSELSGRSLCTLPNMTIGDKQAKVFSSFAKATVEKHFEWMKTYGIDGALLQRFVGEITPSKAEGDVVLRDV